MYLLIGVKNIFVVSVEIENSEKKKKNYRKTKCSHGSSIGESQHTIDIHKKGISTKTAATEKATTTTAKI